MSKHTIETREYHICTCGKEGEAVSKCWEVNCPMGYVTPITPTPTPDTVEAVARAIHFYDGRTLDSFMNDEHSRKNAFGRAQAAIAAYEARRK